MKTASRSSVSGVTLIELMIGMIIGLLLVAFVGSAYIAQGSTSRATDESSRLQETGRIAINALERVIRISGFVPYGEGSTPLDFCPYSATTTDDASGNPPVLGPFVEGRRRNGHLLNSDRLILRFYGSGSDTMAAGDAAIRDCRGVSVPGPASAANNTVNTFYVDSDIDGEPALFCSVRVPGSAAASTTQALIPGVESLQVLFAVTNGTTTAPQRFVNAGDVTDWRRVVAVRLSMMIRGDVGSRPDYDTRNYNMFDADYTSHATGTDSTTATFLPATVVPGVNQRRLRRVFSTTIELRNSPATICL